ncbi:MAG TPA: PAS domain-containing sensor histidine kinase [Syntrophus sp. (in: bacteria)]|nr:PAS domain-containing sensor histidine kinase [Syntrophus sp. (in: bacteria)]
MKSALEKRILIFALVVLTLTIAVNTGFNIESYRRDYRDGIILRCQSLGKGLDRSIEKVLALGLPLTEMEGINARCQEIVKSDPEITYCLVEAAQGGLLYSNDPSLQIGVGAKFIQGESNSAVVLMEFPNLGKVYDVTENIYGPDGRLVGRIRLGFPLEALDMRVANMFRRSLLVLGAALLVVFGVVVLFVKRDIVAPIRRLSSVAGEITSGNFRVSVPAMSSRDFEELGGALREMARSLQERDERIQEGYAELELANRELQQSYEYQERISAELGHSREMYRSLLEDAGDATLVTDEDDRIVLINKAAERFFNISRPETTGTNLFMVLERLHCGNVEEQFDLFQQIRRGVTQEGEVVFQRTGEHERIVGWLRGSPVVGPDGRKMVQTTIRDVTREREIKDNLEQATRDLKNLNQMKDSFLGMASHELKTPLTVIIGYSELILGDMAGKADKTVLAMVKYMADAAERLSSIVRDMVDVSMLDRKKMQLNKRDTDMNELIKMASREMEFFFQIRKQQMRLELTDNLPTVRCDPDRFIQVLTNLIGNAIKFTPDGGTVTVESRLTRNLREVRQTDEAEVVAIDSRPHSYLEVVVRDNGIGINEEDQVQIFDKFYEVGKIEEHFTGKVAFKGKGTGLGLAIVKGIVDMHAGAIWVESPGQDAETCPGSAFHVLLPLTLAETQESARYSTSPT